MNLIFLGPPGSGKGTQAKKLAARLGILHLSTGDLLRDSVRVGSDLGKKAQKYMESGELVPDDVIIGLIETILREGKLNHGFILDGFPRTVPQAEALKKMFEKNDVNIDRAILFLVSDGEVIKRLSGRFYCPVCNAGYNYPAQMPRAEGRCDKDGAALKRRPDDEVDVVKNRLEVYRKQTSPIVDYYRKESVLSEIRADDNPDLITDRLLKELEKVAQV